MIIIRKIKTATVGNTAACVFTSLMMGYLLIFPTYAAESVRIAMERCAVSLIPALFPFAVLVGIMNGTGISEKISTISGATVKRLFGINSEAVYALILGSLGGFPIGALCVKELYTDGKLSLKEAERLTALSSNASPAFCIAVIGKNVLGSTYAGVKLYICQLAAALIIGLITRPKKFESTVTPSVKRHLPLSAVITEAVGNSAAVMLKVCAFTAFFAVVGDLVCRIAERFLGIGAAVGVAALTELTLAGKYAARLDGTSAAITAAFAVGWAGISVHMQTSAALQGSGIGTSYLRRLKLLQGLICAALTAITL